MMLVAVATLMAACSDYDYEAAESQISIVESHVLFSAKGGTGTVEYQAPGTATASLNSSWCTATVNGSIVTVTANPNTKYEGRSAKLVLYYGNDSTVVIVQQLGADYDNSGVPSEINVGDTVSNLAYPLVSNLDVIIETSDDWITAYFENDSLHIDIAENTTGDMRDGYVVYGIEGMTDTITVSQFDFDNIFLGQYNLYYYDFSENGYKPYSATLEKDGDNYLINILNMIYIPVTVDKETLTLSIYNMQYCGSYGGVYYLYTSIVGVDSGYTALTTATSEDVSISGSFTKDEDGYYFIEFAANDTWPANNFGADILYRLAIRAYGSKDPTQSSLGSLLNLNYPLLYKDAE